MTRTITVDHLARVEGHGGIRVELDRRGVKTVQFDIFEGPRLIEGLLAGHRYPDVSQIVSRICAICSVAHSLTSIKATENAFGIRVTRQTDILRDLLFRGENIESHALHIFLLAVPDYLGFPSAIAMAGSHPEAVQLGLRLKKLGNTIQETIGGRAVHPVNAVLGGFGRVPSTGQLVDLREALVAAVADCERAIEILAGLPRVSFGATDTAYAALRSPNGYGYYLGEELILLRNGEAMSFAAADYRSLAREEAVRHSHAKFSRHDGEPFMVGSLARLTINGGSLSGLSNGAHQALGLELPSGNPMDNNKAQAVELVHDVEQALLLVERLLDKDVLPEEPVEITPRAGTGTAVCEAPRGTLIHSYTYDDSGRIEAADVITPTALNGASIERHMRCAVEEAGPRAEDAELKRRLEMIARAYDPCVSCSVHLIRVT